MKKKRAILYHSFRDSRLDEHIAFESLVVGVAHDGESVWYSKPFPSWPGSDKEKEEGQGHTTLLKDMLPMT